MNDELYEKNMNTFETYQPHLAPRFKNSFRPYSKTVGSAVTEDLDLDLGHTLLYGTDAKKYADTQIQQFFETQSQRIFQGWPTPPNHGDRVAERMVTSGIAYLDDKGLSGTDLDVDSDGGYLIVFGLGLGLHLEQLIDRLDVRSVIIVEQYDEFLYHAMHHVDFSILFEKLNGRRGSLNIIVENVPEVIANFIFYMMRQDSFGLIDGSYIFDHYSSFVLKEAKSRFLDRLPLLSANPGFFEDEQIMIRNYVGNAATEDSVVFADKPRSVKKTPVIICGSGPSVDTSIDFVKANRNNAIIISCGTGLGALLGYGVRPDYHVEIENTPGPVEIVQGLSTKHDLSEITLIASNTVRPALSACFPKRIHFFRDSVCSSKLFGQRYGEIYYAAPTVANTAARIAFGMGFRTLYLVGVDLGARDKDNHHGRHSIYMADKEFLKTHPGHLAATNYTIQVPGNFGGSVVTNQSFLYASVHFSGLIARYDHVKVWNLSDGIRIPGAIPCLPESAMIQNDVSRKARDLEWLRGEFDVAGKDALVPVQRLALLGEALDQFYDAFERILKSAEPEGLELPRLFDDFKSLLDSPTAADAEICVQRMHIGSMMVCFTFLYRTYRRLPGSARVEFFEFFRSTMLALLAEMRGDSQSLATELQEQAAA